jgi:hypothetical protein
MNEKYSAKLLQPNAIIGRVETWMFALVGKPNDMRLINESAKISKSIRPRRICTNVERENQALVEKLYIGETDMFVMPWDAYQFSLANAIRLRDKWLKERGLFGKAPMLIDAWCDEHDEYPPYPCRVDMPTI